MITDKSKKFLGDLGILISGGILPLAFAPLKLFWIAPLSIALLLYLWIDVSPKRMMWRAFLFGIGFYGVGASWIYISLYQFGNLAFIISILLTALFVITLSLFFILQAFCFAKLFPKNHWSKFLLGFPALWILFEWLRDWLFTGFPWLYLGYSQTNSFLAGYATIFGVYGVSFVVVLIAVCLNILINPALLTTKHTLKIIFRYLSLLLILLIFVGGGVLSNIHWTTTNTKPINISLIQGNIPQQLKWSLTQIGPTLNLYRDLTRKNLTSDLIVWPEAAVPLTLQEAENYIDNLSYLAKKQQTAIMLGIPIMTYNEKFYNAAIIIGNGKGTYNKRHLVPFGEYVPFEKILKSVFRVLNAPMSEFIAGEPDQTLLQTHHLSIATYICYEIAYAELVRNDLPEANVLVVISNDAWFGHSWAAAQHLQIGQMRSIETGRYTLFASNSGYTAVIKPNGKIKEQLPVYKTAVLNEKIYGMTGKTPWIILGTLPIIFGAFILLIVATFYQKR